jgi:hypothetical protein
MTLREKVARELYKWSYYNDPPWKRCAEVTKADCFEMADAIIAMVKEETPCPR